MRFEFGRVHNYKPLDCRKPKSSIMSFTSCRLAFTIGLAAFHSIRSVHDAALNLPCAVFGHGIQLRTLNSCQPLQTAQPKIPEVILQHAVDNQRLVTWKMFGTLAR